MNISKKLNNLGLNPDNSAVIGSGILSALSIRDSNDIDVIVNEETYQRLNRDTRFSTSQNHGREVLTNGLFEIGTSWEVLGKHYKLDDLMEVSQVINGVRYITPEFLLKVKKSWVKDGSVREKDLKDIKLIEDYLGLK